MSSNHSFTQFYSGGLNSQYLLKAFGNNANGQLGVGDNTDKSTPTDVILNHLSPAINTLHITRMDQGSSHSVLFDTDTPKILAAGDNTRGQLGNGTYDSSNYFVEVTGINYGDYFSSTGGPSAVCGEKNTFIKILSINSVKHLYAFGDNSFGQLGLGDTTDRNTATIVPIDTEISSCEIFSTGYNHSLLYGFYGIAPDISYKILGFGKNDSGQLGLGDVSDRYYPTNVSFQNYDISNSINNGGIAYFGCGKNHTAISYENNYNGEIYRNIATFGNNTYGQLGDGTTTNSLSPKIIFNDLSDSNTGIYPLEVHCGESHTVVRMGDNTLRAFGRNNYGQLGLGDVSDRYYPTVVPDISNATDVKCGQYSTTVLLNNGKIKTFGRNSDGQLGDGTTTDRSSPVFVKKSAGGQDVLASYRIRNTYNTNGGFSINTIISPDNTTIEDGSGVIFTINLGLDVSERRIVSIFNGSTITVDDISDIDTSYTTPALSIGTYDYFVENIYSYSETDDSGDIVHTITVVSASPLPCFLEGTRVLTPDGYKRIEEFEPGDRVITADGRIVLAELKETKVKETTKDNAPYIIPRNLFKQGIPSEDVYISPNHAIQIKPKVWIFPKNLEHPSNNVRQVKIGEPLIYYHIETPDYLTDTLVVEGLPVETYGRKHAHKVGYMKVDRIGGYVRVYRDSIESRNIRVV